MGYSIQDIDTRLKVVEDKLDLVMEVASVTRRTPSIVSPGDFVVDRLTLKDLYRELKAQGASLEREKVENGTSE